jgi:hypothetical protein
MVLALGSSAAAFALAANAHLTVVQLHAIFNLGDQGNAVNLLAERVEKVLQADLATQQWLGIRIDQS